MNSEGHITQNNPILRSIRPKRRVNYRSEHRPWGLRHFGLDDVDGVVKPCITAFVVYGFTVCAGLGDADRRADYHLIAILLVIAIAAPQTGAGSGATSNVVISGRQRF